MTSDWFDFSSMASTTINYKNIVDLIYEEKISDQQGPWIAGGMPRDLLENNTDFSDIDIWFESNQQMSYIKSKLLSKFHTDSYEVYTSKNAITYQIGDYKVQFIIKKYYKTWQEILSEFDFVCCQLILSKDYRVFGPGCEDVRQKTLRINRLHPETFIARYAKYLSYGYVMENTELLSALNRTDINYEFNGQELY